MTSKNKLHLPPDLKDRFTAALGGKRPTAARLLQLIERQGDPPMDKTDVEAGRTPYTAREHVQQLAATDPDLDARLALEGVQAAQEHRLAEGKERVKERIAEHRERGLDPQAPPEDPVAAAAAEDALPPVIPPPADVRDDPRANAPVGAFEHDPEIDAIERQKSEGLARAQGAFERRERGVLSRMPAIASGKGRLKSLEEAAEILIAELESSEIDAIRQVCAEDNLEPWWVVCGALKRQAQLQELHAGEFDPDWRNRTNTGGRPVSVREQKCQTCGGVLPSDARRGQTACCNNHGSEITRHSEGCSLAYLQMQQGRWVDTRGVRA